MSKVTIINKETDEMDLLNIPEGTFFTGRVGNHKGLFLRAFEVVVQIDDPNATWGQYGLKEIFVEDYEPVDIKIEVKKCKDN